MESVSYNSRSEEFKKPFGAIKTGEDVSFHLHISKSLNPINTNLVVRPDGQTQSIYYNMQKSGETEDFIIFSCSHQCLVKLTELEFVSPKVKRDFAFPTLTFPRKYAKILLLRVSKTAAGLVPSGMSNEESPSSTGQGSC